MYMSLPLPVDKCEINVVYVPYLPLQRQLAIKIQLEREATIKELKQQVEKSIAASPSLSIQEGHSASTYANQPACVCLLTAFFCLYYTVAGSGNLLWKDP